MKVVNFRFAKLGIAAAWAAAIGGAQAYNVGDVGLYNNATGIYTYVYEGSYLDTASASVNNSTLVTERKVLTTAVETQANMVLNQISSRLASHPASAAGTIVSLLPQSGGNAGSMDQRSSVWASAGYDHLKEDNISKFGGWNANLWSLAVGYDYKFNDKVLAGLALTYSNLNGSTGFNKGKIKDNAYGVVPYIAFKAAPCFDIDLMLGYSRVNKDRKRTTPSLTSLTGDDLTGIQATSSPKADRYFGAVFANYRHHVNQLNLLARLGYFYATDRQKSFNEANGDTSTGTNQTKAYSSQTTNLSRLSLRLQAGFKANHNVEPYAFLSYARDFGASKMKVQDALPATAPANIALISPNKQRNNNTFGGGLGLNASVHCGWTLGAEATYAQSKKFKNMGGQLRVGKKF